MPWVYLPCHPLQPIQGIYEICSLFLLYCIFFGLYFQIEHKVSAAHIAFRKMNLTKIHTMHSFNKHLFLNASYTSGFLLAQGT